MKRWRMVEPALTLMCVVVCGNVCAVDLNVTREGGIAFDGGGISVVTYRPGWSGTFGLNVDLNSMDSPARRFAVVEGSTKMFEGTSSWSMQDDGTVKGMVSLVCVAPVEVQSVVLSAAISSVPPSGLGGGTAQEYELPTKAGGSLRLRFDAPVRYSAQDSRKWNGLWAVRFGGVRGAPAIPGDTLSRRAYAVGDRIEWNLTFSSENGISLKQSEPYVVSEGDGWVMFDRRNDILPGSALDFSAMGLQDAPAGKHGWLKAKGGHFEFENLPGVEQRFYGVNLCYSANFPDHNLADRVVDRFVRCGYNTVRIHHHDGAWTKSEKNREKLDYLVAKCIERGLYITTDLYVSRPTKQKKYDYKRMVGTNDVTFCDWADFARKFLEHVNPYTGRAYKDEPGMPLVSLVNEGGESRAVWEKCSAFVRSLGAKALLTNDNDGTKHGEGEGLTPLYDYIDNHVYVDHPRFIDKKWQLPSVCDNMNPIRAKRPWLFHVGYAKGASKPYTLTEWNFSGPGLYRGMGGLLAASQAAEQEWDGLWRFAYTHSVRDLVDVPEGQLSYFDCATDPLITTSDRACVCLFLRGDADSGGSQSSATTADAQERVTPALRLDRERGSMTIATSRTCGGFAESGTVDAGSLSFTICTNAVAHRIVPTTLWVSSIDGRPVAESSRMLLTHLTNAQGAGATFEDATRTTLLNWGKGCLVESGVADVALRVNEPDRCRIYALAANGARRFVVPCRIEGKALRFSVSTRGCDGKGVLQYEIVR